VGCAVDVNLLLQKWLDVLPNETGVLFFKYDDPPYAKVEKLDIMVRQAGDNVDVLLNGLE
jgi:AP-1 complex subunit beta-1